MIRSIVLFAVFILAFSGCYEDEWKRYDETSSSIVLHYPGNNELLNNVCTEPVIPIDWYFQWSASPLATEFELVVKNINHPSPLIDVFLSEPYFYYFSYEGMNNDNLTGWRWRVRAKIKNTWRAWSEERSFTVRPLNSGC